jgi:hypothetical protein
VEVSRKHGAFDTRWPCAQKRGSFATPTARLLRVAEAAEALDWERFSARHFPERARHGSAARSAYAAYKQGHEWRPEGLRLVPTEDVAGPVGLESIESKETGTRRLLAAISAVGPHEAQVRVPTGQR